MVLVVVDKIDVNTVSDVIEAVTKVQRADEPGTKTPQLDVAVMRPVTRKPPEPHPYLSAKPRPSASKPSPRARPPRVRQGAISHSGRLTEEQLKTTVSTVTDRLQRCYWGGLQKNPNLIGRVTVRFVIGADGRVSQVGGGGDVPDGDMIECVVKQFYGLQFPKPPSGIVTVSWPMVFTPGR